MARLSELSRGIGLWSGYVIEQDDSDGEDGDTQHPFGDKRNITERGDKASQEPPRLGDISKAPQPANKPTLPPQTLTTRAGPMMLYVPTKPKPVRPRKNYIYTPPAGLLSQSKGELYTSRHNYVSDAEESSQQKERFKKWETYNDSLRAPRFLFAYAMDINERKEDEDAERKAKKNTRFCRRFVTHFKDELAELAQTASSADFPSPADDEIGDDYNDDDDVLNDSDGEVIDELYSTLGRQGSQGSFGQFISDHNRGNGIGKLQSQGQGNSANRVKSAASGRLRVGVNDAYGTVLLGHESEGQGYPRSRQHSRQLLTGEDQVGDEMNYRRQHSLNSEDDDGYLNSREDFNQSNSLSDGGAAADGKMVGGFSPDQRSMSSRMLTTMDRDGIIRSRSCVDFPTYSQQGVSGGIKSSRGGALLPPIDQRPSRSAMARTEGNSRGEGGVEGGTLERDERSLTVGRHYSILAPLSPVYELLSETSSPVTSGRQLKADQVLLVSGQTTRMDRRYCDGEVDSAKPTTDADEDKSTVTWKDSVEQSKEQVVFTAIRSAGRGRRVQAARTPVGDEFRMSNIKDSLRQLQETNKKKTLKPLKEKQKKKAGEQKTPAKTKKKAKGSKKKKKVSQEIQQGGKEDDDNDFYEETNAAEPSETLMELAKSVTQLSAKGQSLKEETFDAEAEAMEAKEMEEEARRMMSTQRESVRRDREQRRLEAQEKRRLEREAQAEEERRREEEARRKQLEFEMIIADAKVKRRLMEEEEERRAEQERLEAERREEEEEAARLQKEEDDRRQVEEDKRLEDEAVAFFTRRRLEAEKRQRTLIEEEMKLKEQLERERLALEEEERRMMEEMEKREERARMRREEEQRYREELEQKKEAEKQAQLAAMRQHHEDMMRKYRQDQENRATLKLLKFGQEFTKSWIFSYFVLWPRGSYERLLGTEKGYSNIQKRTQVHLKAKHGLFQV